MLCQEHFFIKQKFFFIYLSYMFFCSKVLWIGASTFSINSYLEWRHYQKPWLSVCNRKNLRSNITNIPGLNRLSGRLKRSTLRSHQKISEPITLPWELVHNNFKNVKYPLFDIFKIEIIVATQYASIEPKDNSLLVKP